MSPAFSSFLYTRRAGVVWKNDCTPPSQDRKGWQWTFQALEKRSLDTSASNWVKVRLSYLDLGGQSYTVRSSFSSWDLREYHLILKIVDVYFLLLLLLFFNLSCSATKALSIGGLGAFWCQNRFAVQRRRLVHSYYTIFIEVKQQGHRTALVGADRKRKVKRKGRRGEGQQQQQRQQHHQRPAQQ